MLQTLFKAVYSCTLSDYSLLALNYAQHFVMCSFSALPVSVLVALADSDTNSEAHALTVEALRIFHVILLLVRFYNCMGCFCHQESSVFGCEDCNCDMGGASSTICDDVTGQCTCRPRVEGRACNK